MQSAVGVTLEYRARSRVGEDCYRLLTNNCEHFCEWCLRGEPRSYQIERVFWLPQRLLRMLRNHVREVTQTAVRVLADELISDRLFARVRQLVHR